jgi:AraC-like DNA-binding protein
VIAADLVSGVRLRRRTYRPGIEETENSSGDYLLVLPVLHGRIKLEGDDAIVYDGPVQPGTVWIVQPGQWARITPAGAFESAIFRVPGAPFRRTALEHNFRTDEAGRLNVRPVIHARHGVQRMVPLLRTVHELQRPQRDLLISGLALAVMALVLNVDAHKTTEQMPGFDDEQFEAVFAFARSRLSEHLDLREWADSVGLPLNEFAHRFQQHTGVAPYTWFMDRRIDEAKRLMAESRMPLVEIALESGFCSQSHFTEAFRRRVGTSPGRWRAAQAGLQS